jgi:predicted branched-subunit amino acid permease
MRDVLADSPSAAFRRGLVSSLPFQLVIAPFGLLFGVVATEAGLGVAEAMGFSVLVIAGASQFTAVQMLDAGAPTLVILATALAVNLRMAMYSASLATHLGGARLWQRALVAYANVDQTYVCSIADYERHPDQRLSSKLAFFLGTAVLTCPLWVAATLAGALIGDRMPEGLALDFALPITFLAMVAPMLRTLAHVAAAAVSVVGALVLAGLPSGTGLLVAAVAAMATGAGVEAVMGRRP